MSTAAAATAAHRFGLSEPSLAGLDGDPAGWLLGQIGPADPAAMPERPATAEVLRRLFDYRRRLQAARTEARRDSAPMTGPAAAIDEAAFFRPLIQDDLRARLSSALATRRPFAERLALFWANHFTVSVIKGPVRGLAGPFERDAIRPHLAGSFEQLLGAAVRHPAMLLFLDNQQSAGPRSRVVRLLAARGSRDGVDPERPVLAGLNENLARELLELHTLGVAGGGSAFGGWGGYTQADVTETARLLTGWRISPRDVQAGVDASAGRFDAAWHEPGAKTVLGRRYAEGAEALDALLRDLARHPSTARFVSFKLARHFVADDPPPALVAAMADAWRRSDGDLPTVYRTLVASPLAWQPEPAKLKTPEEFAVSSLRLLDLDDPRDPRGMRAAAGVIPMGQRPQAAPSPAGWPDRAEDWIGPEAVWKRVEWADTVATRLAPRVDARALAEASLGPRLQAETRQQIARAADGAQALALLLLAPEFQRR